MSNTRAINYFLNIKGSLIVSFLSAALSALKEYLFESQDYCGYHKSCIIDDKKVIRHYTIAKNDELELKRIGMITQQSYADSGYKGILIVEFKPDDCLASTYAFPHKGRSGAVVTFNYPEIKTYTPEQVYAVAGHEAVHGMHRHYPSLTNVLWWGISMGALSYAAINAYKTHCTFSKVPTVQASAYITCSTAIIALFAHAAIKGIDKLCEIDADITSVKKLGTSEQLIQVFERLAKEPSKKTKTTKHFLSDVWLFKTHPEYQTRINYLQHFKQDDISSKLINSKKNLVMFNDKSADYNDSKIETDTVFNSIYVCKI